MSDVPDRWRMPALYAHLTAAALGQNLPVDDGVCDFHCHSSTPPGNRRRPRQWYAASRPARGATAARRVGDESTRRDSQSAPSQQANDLFPDRGSVWLVGCCVLTLSVMQSTDIELLKARLAWSRGDHARNVVGQIDKELLSHLLRSIPCRGIDGNDTADVHCKSRHGDSIS